MPTKKKEQNKKKEITMSSVLDLNLNDVKEPTTVPEGTYKLRLTSGVMKVSKKGKKYLNASFDILNQDEPTEAIFHMMMLPEGEDAATDERRKLDIKRFCESFELPLEIELGEDSSGNTRIVGWKGQEGWASLKDTHDEEYGDRNEVRRFVTAGN